MTVATILADAFLLVAVIGLGYIVLTGRWHGGDR